MRGEKKPFKYPTSALTDYTACTEHRKQLCIYLILDIFFKIIVLFQQLNTSSITLGD